MVRGVRGLVVDVEVVDGAEVRSKGICVLVGDDDDRMLVFPVSLLWRREDTQRECSPLSVTYGERVEESGNESGGCAVFVAALAVSVDSKGGASVG